MTDIADLRAKALHLFQAAIDAADPARAVTQALDEELRAEGTLYLVAVGKAAVPMMRAAQASLAPGQATRALLITNPENAATLPGVDTHLANHPVPDAAGEAAAHALEALLANTSANDRVIALISGGGSALLPAPVAGVTLQDKATLNELLLGSGLEINDMNHIRQQVSRLKGGGLLRAAAPAKVTAYILSDVVGDDLRAIASGPTVAPIGTKASATALMQSAGIWDAAPASIRAHLNQPDAPQDLPPADNHLVASNRQSLDAMRAAAPEAQILNDRLEGNVAQVAPQLAEIFKTLPADAPATLLFGGETTVTLTGTGSGGRNQDLALRMALQDIPGEWVFLSGGTDGRDGPTDAAGGMVDSDTATRLKTANIDAKAHLQNNDAYPALKASDDLIITGGTGTNVADVMIFMRTA